MLWPCVTLQLLSLTLQSLPSLGDFDIHVVYQNYSMAANEWKDVISPGYPYRCCDRGFSYYIRCQTTNCKLKIKFLTVEIPDTSIVTVYEGSSLAWYNRLESLTEFDGQWDLPTVDSSSPAVTVKFTTRTYRHYKDLRGIRLRASATGKDEKPKVKDNVCTGGEKQCSNGVCIGIHRYCPESPCPAHMPYRCGFTCFSSSQRCTDEINCDTSRSERECNHQNNPESANTNYIWFLVLIIVVIVGVILIDQYIKGQKAQANEQEPRRIRYPHEPAALAGAACSPAVLARRPPPAPQEAVSPDVTEEVEVDLPSNSPPPYNEALSTLYDLSAPHKKEAPPPPYEAVAQSNPPESDVRLLSALTP